MVKIITWLSALCMALGLIGYVGLQLFPLDGTVTRTFPFNGRSIWMYPFQPGERVTSPGPQEDHWTGQRIIAEPVYTSIRPPGPYEHVDIAMELRVKDQPLIELGILRDEEQFAFEYHPLYSEELNKGWQKTVHNGIEGFIRDDGVPSDLLSRDTRTMVLWGASSTMPELADTIPLERRLPLNSRGTHDFWFVPTQGAIEVEFVMQDSNRSRAETAQVAAFVLKKGDELIATEAVSVSGVADQTMSKAFTKKLYWNNLTPGVYRLQFLADDDFFLREIYSTNRRWVMGTRLYMGDTAGYHATSTMKTWFTNAQTITAEIRHPDTQQALHFGSENRDIQVLHTPYVLRRAAADQQAPWVQIKAEKGNIRLVSDGYFAPDQQALFYPVFRKLTADSQLMREGVRAVQTPYQGAIDMGDGWYRVQTSFTIPKTSAHQRIALSAPGITSRLGAVDIRFVTIRYRRNPLTLNSIWEVLLAEGRRAKRSLFERYD